MLNYAFHIVAIKMTTVIAICTAIQSHYVYSIVSYTNTSLAASNYNNFSAKFQSAIVGFVLLHGRFLFI